MHDILLFKKFLKMYGWSKMNQNDPEYASTKSLRNFTLAIYPTNEL